MAQDGTTELQDVPLNAEQTLARTAFRGYLKHIDTNNDGFASKAELLASGLSGAVSRALMNDYFSPGTTLRAVEDRIIIDHDKLLAAASLSYNPRGLTQEMLENEINQLLPKGVAEVKLSEFCDFSKICHRTSNEQVKFGVSSR